MSHEQKLSVKSKLGCLRQRLLSSPLERGAGGVLRQTYTPLYPLFLEGNHKRLKFLKQELRSVIQQETTYSIKTAQNRELD